MVGVYVHALAFVDVRAIFMWCACCMCVHVLCMCDDASGVWLAIVGALGARVGLYRAGGYHTSTIWALVVCKCGGSCVFAFWLCVWLMHVVVCLCARLLFVCETAACG